MSKLKPCPFCGGKAITSTFFDWDDLDYMAFEVNDSESIDGEVTCENESCINGWWLPPELWNIRPVEDALNKRIAELEAVNKVLKDEYEALRKEHERMYRLFRSGSTLPEPPVDHLTAHEATERQDDKWIPVSERLPDNWMSVLTIDRSKSTREMVTAFYNPETSLWSTHLPIYDLWVTHWMPLPEPPIMYGKEREE